MTFNQTGTAVRFSVGAAAAALCSVPNSNDAAFQSFVADMKVDDSTQAALTEKGSGLSANKQHQLSYRGTSLVSGWLKNV